MADNLYKPSTRTELAKRYGVSAETMKKWLGQVPELSLTSRIRTLTPKQVEHIIKHLGEPPD